jgi:filamentous hemagglutinin
MKTLFSKFGSVGDWQKIDEKFDGTITKQSGDASCVSAVGEMLARHYGLNTNQQEILDNIGEWSNSFALSKFLSSKETKKSVEWLGSAWDNELFDERYILGISKKTKVWAVMFRKGSPKGHALLIDGVDENDLIIIKDPFDQTTYKMEAKDVYELLSEFVLRRRRRHD